MGVPGSCAGGGDDTQFASCAIASQGLTPLTIICACSVFFLVISNHFWSLLMPFALLAGLVSLGMIVTHGATLIMGRTAGPIAARARQLP